MAKQKTTTQSETPFNPEMERAVLGSIFMQPDFFYEAFADLVPEDFFLDSNRRIYRALIEMVGTKKPIDLTSVMSYIQDRGDLDVIGGPAYIASLIDGVPDTADLAPYLEHYVVVLKEASRRRKVIHLCNAAKQQALDPSEAISFVLSGLYEDVLRIQGDSKVQKGQFVREFSAEVIRQVEEEMGSTRDVLGLSLGISNLDESTTGIRKGELVIVGGFPGSGKTAFILTIAAANARADVPVCVFSREMDKQSLLLRLWAQESGLSYGKLRNPKNLHSSELRELRERWIPQLSTWPLMVDDEVVMIDDMISRAHLYRRKYGTQLFIVDYLQIIGSKLEKEYERVSECSDKLTQFAKQTGVPVVVASQLTRPEKKDRGSNFEPNMMMLRSSGKIEQNAHVILFTHHPLDENMEPTGEDVIIISKQRAGHRGREKAWFDVRTQKWTERGEVQKAPEQAKIAEAF